MVAGFAFLAARVISAMSSSRVCAEHEVPERPLGELIACWKSILPLR